MRPSSGQFGRSYRWADLSDQEQKKSATDLHLSTSSLPAVVTIRECVYTSSLLNSNSELATHPDFYRLPSAQSVLPDLEWRCIA